MKYKVALHRSEEGYSVSCPGLPGCWSQGQTEQEALDNIRLAIREYLEGSSVRLKREGTNVRRLKAKPAAKARSHPDIVGRKTFSVDEIRKYVDPGPAEEAEKFVRLIYEERRQDRERVLPE